MLRFLPAFVGSACAALAGAPTLPTLYALDRDGFITTVDPATGAVLTSVEVTMDGHDVQTCNGLARHPGTGVLYAVVRAEQLDGGFPNFLATIDPLTGVASPIGDLGDYFAGLAFFPDGTLLGVTGDGALAESTLFRIDTSTAAPTPIVSLGNGGDGEAIATTPNGDIYHASGDSGDEEYFERLNFLALEGLIDILASHSYGENEETLSLAWSDALGEMFGTDWNAQNLFTISLTTGEKTTVGDLNVRIKGLAFDGAALYALENTNPPSLLTLDPSDASVLDVVPITLPGHELENGVALARHPITGVFYAVVREDFDSDGSGDGSGRRNLLVTVDPSTGVDATLIGDLGDDFAALAFRDDGALLGVTGFGAITPKTLYRIDTTTAATTFHRSLPNGSGGGQALASAPDGFVYHAAGYRTGSQVFEKFDPYAVLPPFFEDIPRLSLRSFPGGDPVLSMGWSDALNAFCVASGSNTLYHIGTSSPATFQLAGRTDLVYKGVAFDGATGFAVCAFCPQLVKIDLSGAVLDSRDVTLAGFTVQNLNGLARSPIDGLLYAIVRQPDDTRFLCTFDPVAFDGVATLIGQLPDRFAGLAFRASGVLIGVTGTGAASPNNLYILDTTNAGATPLMNLPGGSSGGQAIAIGADGYLYHMSGAEADDQFYQKVDLDSQTIEVIDTPTHVHSFPYHEATALGYSPSLGAMYVADADGDLWIIDTANGETTSVGHLTPVVDGGDITMKGLAFDEAPVAPCPGDANGDRVVDFADLNIVLTDYGELGPGIAGDLDHDGDVDFADLNIVLTAYGTIC